ncbi:MAG TPA: universal stress protein [Candidatus Dormibacteraeota bacterium]|nr:universal stress protein [Candidatus Dormibacteraeota bacterium]
MDTSKGLEKIVLATDGSFHAEAAVDATIALARGSHAEVRVVHVWNLHIRHRHCPWDVELRGEARRVLDSTVERLTGAGVHADGAILRADGDHVAAAVAITARSFGADLLVVGSRGISDLQSMLEHSVSHQLLASVDCPLLIVRGATATQRPQRVLMVVASGDDIGRAARAAIAVASAPDCLVLVVHAGQLIAGAQGTVYAEAADETPATIAKAIKLIEQAGISARGVMTQPGRAADVIARVAHTWDVDMIVAGSSRMGDLASMVLDSVSHEQLESSVQPARTAELAPS